MLVTLKKMKRSKIECIKEIRWFAHLGLKEAKEVCERLPFQLDIMHGVDELNEFFELEILPNVCEKKLLAKWEGLSEFRRVQILRLLDGQNRLQEYD